MDQFAYIANRRVDLNRSSVSHLLELNGFLPSRSWYKYPDAAEPSSVQKQGCYLQKKKKTHHTFMSEQKQNYKRQSCV